MVDKITHLELDKKVIGVKHILSMKDGAILANTGHFNAEIDIEGLEYDPELRIMGLEAAVTLERPGFRVKKRVLKTAQIGKTHQISKDEAISFVKQMGVEVH